MRLGHAIFVGLMAALLTLAAPTLARNSSQQKSSEAPASSSCNETADGTWTQLPCQESGSRPPTQPKSASKSGGEETR